MVVLERSRPRRRRPSAGRPAARRRARPPRTSAGGSRPARALEPLEGLADVDDDHALGLQHRMQIVGGDLRHRLHRQPGVAPVDHAPLQIADHVVDADARRAPAPRGRRRRRLGQHDDAGARRHEAGHALGELRAVDPDVEGAGRMVLAVRARIAQSRMVAPACAASHASRALIGRGLAAVSGSRPRFFATIVSKAAGFGGTPSMMKSTNAPCCRSGRPVEAPLEADRRRGLRAHRASARAAGAVGRIDLDAVGSGNSTRRSVSQRSSAAAAPPRSGRPTEPTKSVSP